MVFDVEGVLIPRNRFLLLEVGRVVGYSRFLRIVIYGLMYEVGLISLQVAVKGMARVFRGFGMEWILQIFRRIPLNPGVAEAISELKLRGWRIALISSGLPSFLVEDLAARLGADYAVGFRLELAGGVATGEASGEVIEPMGKLRVLRRILEAERISPGDCVIVADDRNNAPMMLKEAFKVGVNPDFVIRVKADHVISGGMDKLIRLLDGEAPKRQLSARLVFREAIHACGFTVPMLVNAIGLPAVALLIIVVTLLYTASMITMLWGGGIPVISWITRHAATEDEPQGFAVAPIYFAVGILLTLTLFPPSSSSAAIAAFAIGDSVATIVGSAIGRHRLIINKGKTVEGAAAGLIAAFVAALAYTSPQKAFIAALTATVIEVLPLPINDNLTIPIISAAALTATAGLSFSAWPLFLMPMFVISTILMCNSAILVKNLSCNI